MNVRDENRAAVALLATVDGVGRVTLDKLQQLADSRSESLANIWESLPQFAGDLRLAARVLESWQILHKKYSVIDYWDHLQEKDIFVILPKDDQYPSLLRQIPDSPAILFAKAQTPHTELSLPIAVVGTRKPTAYGEMVVEILVKQLVEGGATVVSGFMYGIDYAAHDQALAASGSTVGVLGYGFDHVYPKSFAHRMQSFLDQGGVLVSEFAPQVTPQPGNFPLRNRIVAGMALATVVVEAAPDSGSLITAACAIEYDREVCAVPGPITSQYSEGTKWLINQGATLVSSAADIFAQLNLVNQPSTVELRVEYDDELQQQLAVCLASHPTSVDDLAQSIGKSVAEIGAALMLMRLKGGVEEFGEVWRLAA